MNPLTTKQLTRAKFINQFIIDNDNFPTHKQMATAFNIPTSACMNLVVTLTAKGWITQQKTAQSYKRTPAMKERMLS